MNKAKLANTLIKVTIGAVTSVLIGATIKQEHRVVTLLNQHFADKTELSTDL
jgi:hypothetical protein